MEDTRRIKRVQELDFARSVVNRDRGTIHFSRELQTRNVQLLSLSSNEPILIFAAQIHSLYRYMRMTAVRVGLRVFRRAHGHPAPGLSEQIAGAK